MAGTQGVVTAQIKASQANRLEEVNTKRRNIAGQVRALIDQLDAIGVNENLKAKADEERAALRTAYSALAKPLRSQRA